MRLTTITLFTLAVLFVAATVPVAGQENVSVVAESQAAAEGLDLHAVAELFSESNDLEAFEKSLNDQTLGVNNLDLDGNDQVDYIRVVEQSSG